MPLGWNSRRRWAFEQLRSARVRPLLYLNLFAPVALALKLLDAPAAAVFSAPHSP